MEMGREIPACQIPEVLLAGNVHKQEVQSHCKNAQSQALGYQKDLSLCPGQHHTSGKPQTESGHNCHCDTLDDGQEPDTAGFPQQQDGQDDTAHRKGESGSQSQTQSAQRGRQQVVKAPVVEKNTAVDDQRGQRLFHRIVGFAEQIQGAEPGHGQSVCGEDDAGREP